MFIHKQTTFALDVTSHTPRKAREGSPRASGVSRDDLEPRSCNWGPGMMVGDRLQTK